MAEGFIRQRGNAWQVIVHAGRDPLTGKRRNLTGTARTKREAQDLRARLLTQVDEGRRPATDATLAQLLERWLEMADLAWSTRVTYKGYIERTILPTLGPCHCGASTPPPWTASTRSCAAGAASAADRWRRPPCARFTRSFAGPWIRRPAGAGFRLTQRRWPAHPDSGRSSSARPPEEVSRLLETAYEADPDFAVLLWLAATTGARRGELCALRWRNVDLEAAELLILRNLFQAAGRLVGEGHQDPCRAPAGALGGQCWAA
jgi:integrase